MRKNNYLIVINPQSGNKGLRQLNSLISALENSGITYDIYHTVADVSANEVILNKKLDNYTDVIALGGDGTLNMLSNVLANKNIPLGIIPCGTGNDFARNIYKTGDDIIATVTGEKTVKVDLGWCNERYFMNVLGIGYDAMVAKASKTESKILFRSFFYLWNALKYLPLYKEEVISIKADGFHKNEATFMAAFGNGAFFGGGMNISPRADISDGLLDCCWVGKIGFLKRIYCLAKIFSGKHLSVNNIEYLQTRQFHISTKQQPIEADGEFIGYTPATIRIEESALLLKSP